MVVDPKHGSIERLADGTHVVRAIGKAYLLNQLGVVCENPDSPETDRVYAKHFVNKRIFLPDEAELARNEVLSLDQKKAIVIGMTGYSSISDNDCKAWGIQPSAYESACAEILANIVLGLREEYPGIIIGVADGASDMGVDQAVISAARVLGIPHLGHSCPNFMMYVNDDEDAVLVSAAQEEYSDAFIMNLHLLCSIGGRLQALLHDIKAAIVYNKKVLLFDLVRTISTNRGGPPARDADGKIQDATAAFLDAIKLYQPEVEHLSPYDELRRWIRSLSIQEVRKLIPPEDAFSSWRRQL